VESWYKGTLGQIDQSRQSPNLIENLRKKGIIKGQLSLWPEESLRRVQYYNSKKDS
jgi:hypothetical protein